MAKSKTVSNKTAKLKLESKIIKRKSLKKRAALPKKLTKKQIKKSVLPESPPESPTFLQFKDDTIEDSEDDIIKESGDDTIKESEDDTIEESEDDTCVNQTGLLVKAPYARTDSNQIRKGVKALFEYISKTTANKTELFDDEQPIFLQITAIKVPKTPTRQIRLTLTNSLLSDNSEICLIVKDIGNPKDYDGTIEHYQKLLIDNDITKIKTIMPYHQFKSEYGNQFELKRKLLGLYDYFLVDGRISGYVVHLLGKIFLEKRKMPTSITMGVSNLKDHIEKSLKKTIMKMHSNSDSYIVQIGHSKMEEEVVLDNACDIIDELDQSFPGGLDNIRQLNLKTDKSVSIPIYLTLKKKNTVNVPVVLPKHSKHYENVTGELTTLLHKNVTVLPSGKVILVDRNKTKKNDDGEDEDSDFSESDGEEEETEGQFQSDILDNDEESEEEEEETKEVSKRAKNDKKQEIEQNQKLLEEEDDLVQAEQLYLNEYEQSKVNETKSTKKVTSENIKNKAESESPKRKVNIKKQNSTEEKKLSPTENKRNIPNRRHKNMPEENTVSEAMENNVSKKKQKKVNENVGETQEKQQKVSNLKKDKLGISKKENTVDCNKNKTTKKAARKTKQINTMTEQIPADAPAKIGRKTKAKDVANEIPTKKSKKVLTQEVIAENNNKTEPITRKFVKGVPSQKGSKKTKRNFIASINEEATEKVIKNKKGPKAKKLV